MKVKEASRRQPVSSVARQGLSTELGRLSFVRRDVSLARYTTWRVGGPAEFFIEPTDEESVAGVIQFCRENEVPLSFLGRGSNTLIDDRGLGGVVLCTRNALTRLEHRGDRLVAQAGVPSPKLAKVTCSIGFSGYEFLIGIPGGVGGAVIMNAGVSNDGVRGAEIRDVLESVRVIDVNGECQMIRASDLELGYRSSKLLGGPAFILEATFHLSKPEKSPIIRERMATHLQSRKRKQPLSKNTAGSTFKQPAGGKPAGWYIDQAGLKGLRIGGAVVSQKHANWIETVPGAKANDIRRLIEEIQQQVKREFDIWLECEVCILWDSA